MLMLYPFLFILFVFGFFRASHFSLYANTTTCVRMKI